MAQSLPVDSKSKSGSVTTRSDTNHWFFGRYINDVSNNCLPLRIEAVRLYLFKCHERGKSRLLEKEKNAIINEISERFIQVWTSASLPVKSEKAIRSQIKREVFDILEVVRRENPTSATEKWKQNTFPRVH